VSEKTGAAVVCRATTVVSFSVGEDGCCCSTIVCRATAVMSFNVGDDGALVLCRSRLSMVAFVVARARVPHTQGDRVLVVCIEVPAVGCRATAGG